MSLEYRMAFVKSPGNVYFEKKSLPSLNPTEVLIKIKASAFCGSDIHTLKGLHPDVQLPTAIGHEFSGVIEDCGSDVSAHKVGDRVCVEPLLSCGKCYYCLRGQYLYCPDLKVQYRLGQGALADYFVTPERWVYKLPDSVSFNEGSLIEPVSVALHAARRSDLKPGEDVAVFGCGTIGLLLIQVARSLGAANVYAIDLISSKLKIAESFGAIPLDASRQNPVEFLTGLPKGGVDRTFEAVGMQETLDQAIDSLHRGGVLTVVGIFEKPEIRLNSRIFAAREISINGSCAYCWDFSDAIALVADGRVLLQPLITHILALEDLPNISAILKDKTKPPVKIIFNP